MLEETCSYYRSAVSVLKNQQNLECKWNGLLILAVSTNKFENYQVSVEIRNTGRPIMLIKLHSGSLALKLFISRFYRGFKYPGYIATNH